MPPIDTDAFYETGDKSAISSITRREWIIQAAILAGQKIGETYLDDTNPEDHRALEVAFLSGFLKNRVQVGRRFSIATKEGP
jgi:hypothetical protein